MEVRLCINPLEQANWIERTPVLRPVCIHMNYCTKCSLIRDGYLERMISCADL